MSVLEKRVVLFGRTGDGKSAVANLLVTGGVQPVVFPSSDSTRGCTADIQTKSGRGWTVTDTVGLGEGETGTISNRQATAMLTGSLRKVKANYSHIIFVQRAGRVTTLDELNWLLFCQIFQGAEKAFVVLFTEADQEWLDENRHKIPSYMAGIKTLTVDILPISDEPVIERLQTKIRDKSIRKLEEDLLKIFVQRGNQYSVPKIAEMNDAQLEQKARSIMQFIVSAIKRMFAPAMWLKIAGKLSSLVNVAWFILQTV